FRAHAVPFALLVVAMICGTRALAGIWTGDLVPTAIVCLVVALTAGTSLPWGAWPQLASVAIAGLAIASNAYLIAGTSVHATAQLVAAVFTALMVSVVLSFELQRNHRRLVEENIRRRRAEDGLARFNAELESRVSARTAELAAATQRLEREALERQLATQELRESASGRRGGGGGEEGGGGTPSTIPGRQSPGRPWRDFPSPSPATGRPRSGSAAKTWSGRPAMTSSRPRSPTPCAPTITRCSRRGGRCRPRRRCCRAANRVRTCR